MFDLDRGLVWFLHLVMFGTITGVFFARLNYINKKLDEKEAQIRKLKEEERRQARIDEEIRLQKLQKKKKKKNTVWFDVYDDRRWKRPEPDFKPNHNKRSS